MPPVLQLNEYILQMDTDSPYFNEKMNCQKRLELHSSKCMI